VRRALVHLAALLGLLAANPALAAEQLVLAFGDSLTAGPGLKPQENFAGQLQAALRRDGLAVRVHNAGVSGDTTAQGRARLGWVLAGLKAKPDLAIVELGANDMLRGLPPARARANLDAILSELGKRRIPVLLAGMMASRNLDPAYRRQFDAIYPALAKKHSARLYPFFMAGVWNNRAMILPDGLHPNRRGVSVIVGRILPHVKAALAKR
jgi:acyl-CoA thioesterase-1